MDNAANPPPHQPFEKTPLPKAPIRRPPIGYRGNKNHGKPLYDPVYPTKKIPSSLITHYPIDWRNGGRALLVAAMSLIEGKRLKRHKQSLEWQRLCPCQQSLTNSYSPLSKNTPSTVLRTNISSIQPVEDCAQSPLRCLCAWRRKGKYIHQARLDSLLTSFKGEIPTTKPLFSIPYYVAPCNPNPSIPVVYDEEKKCYKIGDSAYTHPAFEPQNYNNKNLTFDTPVSNKNSFIDFLDEVFSDDETDNQDDL